MTDLIFLLILCWAWLVDNGTSEAALYTALAISYLQESIYKSLIVMLFKSYLQESIYDDSLIVMTLLIMEVYLGRHSDGKSSLLPKLRGLWARAFLVVWVATRTNIRATRRGGSSRESHEEIFNGGESRRAHAAFRTSAIKWKSRIWVVCTSPNVNNQTFQMCYYDLEWILLAMSSTLVSIERHPLLFGGIQIYKRASM